MLVIQTKHSRLSSTPAVAPMRCLQGSQVLQFAVIDQECHLTWRASSRLFSRRCGPQRQDKGNAQAWFKAALVYVSICFRVPTPGVVDPFMARAILSACGGGGRRRPVLEDRLPWEGGGGSYERDNLRKDNPYTSPQVGYYNIPDRVLAFLSVASQSSLFGHRIIV